MFVVKKNLLRRIREPLIGSFLMFTRRNVHLHRDELQSNQAVNFTLKVAVKSGLEDDDSMSLTSFCTDRLLRDQGEPSNANKCSLVSLQKLFASLSSSHFPSGSWLFYQKEKEKKYTAKREKCAHKDCTICTFPFFLRRSPCQNNLSLTLFFTFLFHLSVNA